MNILFFALKTILVSSILYGYYCLFLRNRAFSHYNRFFLLSIPFLSLLIPALQLNVAGWDHSPAANPIRLLAVVNGHLDETFAGYGQQSFWKDLHWEPILLAATGLITLVLGFRLYRSLHYLMNLKRSTSPLSLEGARVYLVRAKGTPFSFFTSIFWNADQDLTSADNHRILQHELYHVCHRHSIDILLLEVLRTVCWFNPFIYLVRREIQVVHEFLADAFAAGETDQLEYARLLVTTRFRQPLSITHPFIQHSIKRRIAMITRTSKTKPGLLGRIMIMPLLLLLTLLFAFKM
ncbi:MAG TPA: M56 family metallopeptidase, partial [Puia sp.]|nr:M56 family metallopeptidase [Puia sp.]